MDSMKNNPIASTIAYHIKQNNNKTAIKINNEEITYAQLDQIANNIIRLVSLDTKEKSLRIGVCLSRNRYLIPAIWAICKMGQTYVPLDPEAPAERLQFMMKDCKISVVLTETAFLHQFNNNPVTNIIDCSIVSEGTTSNTESVPYNPDPDIAYIIYTSGTTGQPKGVPITYNNLYNLLQVISLPDYFNISSHSRVLEFASINFDASIPEIYTPLFCGSTLILATENERHDINLLSKLMREEEITFATLPPSLVTLIPNFDFPALDTLIIAGERMIAEIARHTSKYHFRLINAYGPTENTVLSTMREVNPHIAIENIGHPIPGVVGYVIRLDQSQVEVGEIGELCVGGIQLTKGYLNRPELNQEKFIPNPFSDKAEAPILYRTGDLVRLAPDGSYDFIGRIDSQIKFNGYRIELEEINRQIEQCEHVIQAYVKIESFGSGKYLVAYIKMELPNDLDQIKEKVKKFLPNYMLPTYWIPVEEFPLTINGKIDSEKLMHKRLKKEVVSLHAEERTEAEKTVANIVAQILGKEDIDIDLDLLDDLGLTSIQIMKIPMDLEFLGFQVSVNDIYQQRTVRRIAQNHSHPLSYWYNQPDTNKPLLVVVSGYTSFTFLYTELAHALSDRYSIYVIESYHDYSEESTQSATSLIQTYTDILLPIAEKHPIAAITGFCMGGELGLYLAHTLHEQKKEILPHVIVLDGEVHRGKDRSLYVQANYPAFTQALNDSRFDRDMRLGETMPDFHYEGAVTTILADRFNPQLSFNPDDTFSEAQIKFARESYDRNFTLWKTCYPTCELITVPANHLSFFSEKESLEIQIRYFLSL